DLLIGIDGSRASLAAAETAVRLFGPRVRRVTLATVLDIETATPHGDSLLNPEPWPEEVAARDGLAAAVASLKAATGYEAGSVLLAGPPADALERHALDEEYEVIVVGRRGRGLARTLLGSCASALASRTNVPVL